MRVFLTGATGAVGTPVAAELKERGHDVVALVRSDANAKRMYDEGYHPVVGDMCEPDGWSSEAESCDRLIHAAWVRPGRRMGMSWVRATTHADAIVVDALIDVARRSSRCKALLLTSGHSVYGDHGDEWIDDETAPVPGAVGSKQLACERKAMAAAADGVSCFVIRPCTVYGPRGPAMDYFFGSAMKGAIRYPGNGNNFFPFIRDTDLADAYALAVEQPPIGEIISVGDDEPLRLSEVARVILDEFGGGTSGGVPRWLVALMGGGPLAEMLTQSFRVRNDKAKRLLGWQPRNPTLRDGIAAAVESWRCEQAGDSKKDSTGQTDRKARSSFRSR